MSRILDINISAINYSNASHQIVDWGRAHESRYVCACNVHMIMEAHDHLSFRQILNNADLVTPDGMPLVWMMRIKGEPNQSRVYGPTLMLHILALAEKEKLPIGFLGSTDHVLTKLSINLKKKFLNLMINYCNSPSFGKLSETENNKIIEEITQSKIQILFVGLGCPKQEIWMAEHKGKIPAVMVGVGAAFDFHAGVKPQSPPFLQKLGLEWLFRLFHEPRRLWKRYLYNNPRFIILAIADLLGLYHPAKMK